MKKNNSFLMLSLIAFSVLLLSACSAKKEDADFEKAKVLRLKISDCRRFMSSDSEKISDKIARLKRQEAEKNADELKKLAGKSSDNAVKEALSGVDDDIRKIKELEALISCRQKLNDKGAGLKHASYLSGREMVIKGIFKTFKYAVLAVDEFSVDKSEKGESGKHETLAKSVRQTADIARTVAEFLSGNTYADDKEGREKLSADLDTLASKPLPELNLLLSLTYVVSGQDELALFEIENCNPSAFQDTKYLSVKDKLMFYHIVRGWIFHSFGWEPLSALEMGKLEKMMADENESSVEGDLAKRNQTLSFWHLFLAYHYGYEKGEYEKMDQHLAWLIRLNPDSELVVYLSGQKHAADGTYEKADKSLELDYSGTGDEAVIKLFAERVRAVRDSAKLEPPPRVMSDPRFIMRLAFTIANKYAVKASKSEFLSRMLISIRDFWKFGRAEEKPALETIKPENQESEKPAGDADRI